MKSGIEEIIREASQEFANKLDQLNDDFILRQAIAKMALRDVSWAIADRFDLHLELSEHLHHVANALEDTIHNTSEDS